MPHLEERQVKRLVRLGLVLALVVAVPVALAVNSVVDLWYSWAGAIVGAMLIPVVLAYRGGKVGSGFVFCSMLVSATVSLVWMGYGLRTNNMYLEVVWLKIDGAWRVVMPQVADILQPRATDSMRLGVGTLLPGLVISAIILSIGHIASRKQP
jgi:SSS family solute:Na+ symporter